MKFFSNSSGWYWTLAAFLLRIPERFHALSKREQWQQVPSARTDQESMSHILSQPFECSFPKALRVQSAVPPPYENYVDCLDGTRTPIRARERKQIVRPRAPVPGFVPPTTLRLRSRSNRPLRHCDFTRSGDSHEEASPSAFRQPSSAVDLSILALPVPGMPLSCPPPVLLLRTPLHSPPLSLESHRPPIQTRHFDP